MSTLNPFRRHLDGGAITASTSSPTVNPTNTLASNLIANPAKPLPSVPDYGKSSLSLEIEEDDSTSSDEKTADPFNPDSSVSDSEDNLEAQNPKSSVPGDHRDSFGSAPHSAPSADRAGTPPAEAPLTPSEYDVQSRFSSTESSSDEDVPVTRSAGAPSQYKQSTSPVSQTSRDKKPPPPPKSHHGKRINTSGDTASQSTAFRLNNRLSFHASSPESLSLPRTAGTPNASSTHPSVPDYFSIQIENQAAVALNGSLSRSDSQNRRPPTPPLSRRQNQMRRSKSTQSKSSASRLTLSSVDYESNDSSQPPSPGLSTRSGTSSLSRDRKRTSMPPPSSTISSGGASDHLSPSTISPRPHHGRRASSYGNIVTASSSVAPPPPPPRRARGNSRGEGRPLSQLITPEEPLPQPSNAQDILADLSRLQKEVDDLRGHYENRNCSQ
ncbi:uncharacterized protein N7483_007777 [Penicillium malachiteum]|uniref:uncharacterized protein n=1 Tax=Penicillium malachiteum TaxID=1324776 RepID=UPI002548CD7C|nr:uncharacterized protein N7483_007777 [Penicillium malachiteum]KAJ5726420.1 hypothetical protein N7483_007777 [Penicillium malachiteum]